MTSGRAQKEGTESLWSIGPRKSAPDSYLKYRGTNKKRRYCERLASELQQRHTRLFCRHKSNGISKQIILLLGGTDLDQVFVYMVVKAVLCARIYEIMETRNCLAAIKLCKTLLALRKLEQRVAPCYILRAVRARSSQKVYLQDLDFQDFGRSGEKKKSDNFQQQSNMLNLNCFEKTGCKLYESGNQSIVQQQSSCVKLDLL